MRYGGGAAPPVKPSELDSFLLPMAASKSCGNLQQDWQFIRGRWSTPSRTEDASSNPHFALEPPSAIQVVESATTTDWSQKRCF